MYQLLMYHREEFLEHYHRRFAVESGFPIMKAKFGDSIRSKSDQGQVNEVLCRNICVQIRVMHELGIEPTF